MQQGTYLFKFKFMSYFSCFQVSTQISRNNNMLILFILICILIFVFKFIYNILICLTFNFNLICFRSPYWQIAIDAVTVCGPGFKAPSADELAGPILSQRVADVEDAIKEQREVWKTKGCTIMTDGWTDRRSRTLLNFLVSSSGNCTYYLES